HFSVRLVILPEIVLLRFSLNYFKEKLPELLIARAGTQRLHDVELEVAAETWPNFTIASQAKFVTAFTKMQIGHRADESYALVPSRNLIVSGGAVGVESWRGNQVPISRLDFAFRFRHREKISFG